MLRWIHAEKRRFYKVSLQVDLFGSLHLLLEWGSLDTRNGHFKTLTCEGVADAKAKLRAVRKRRRQHGYMIHHCLEAL